MVHGHRDTGSPAMRGTMPDLVREPVKDLRESQRVRACSGKEDAHDLQDTRWHLRPAGRAGK